MKPASRIQATIEILEAEQLKRMPLDACVGDYMRNRRYIGSKDRAEVAERIYNMTRAHARLGWWLDHTGAPDTPRNRMICWLALAENISAERYAQLFDDSQYAPQILSDEEIDLAEKVVGKDLDHDDMPQTIRLECPPQYEEALRTVFGDAFGDEMTAMLEPATLDLRVNAYVMDRENARQSLYKDGVETDFTTLSPWGLRCREKAYLSKTKAMNKGWVEIQDEGSQMIAHICDVKPGMQILDYCAGGGGKALALAAAMQRKGRLVAMDIDARRLEKGRVRYKKAGIADIIEVRPLSDDRHRKWLKRQKGTFDVTIIDVPCSGTGTWRRNPDMRWRSNAPELSALLPVQAEILDKIAHTVKTGGKLVYATCSLLRAENEDQIEAFLARNPDFEVAPLDEKLNIGSPFMRLTPHRHTTDGFFAAVLVRKAQASPVDTAPENA